ncbi:MAG: serine acetyltransferase [Muribaculaceae bacterium]|nr:serine acetyltransferase [Muribaculaceae bacterium]
MNELIEDTLKKNVAKLSELGDTESQMITKGNSQFPSVDAIKEMVSLVKSAVFPNFYDRQRNSRTIRAYFIGTAIERLHTLLCVEIAKALNYDREALCDGSCETQACKLSLSFIDSMPRIKHLLYTDVKAMFENDPAVDNYGEIILSYPVVKAMISYRVAHELLKLGVPVIPRMLTELAHSATGIDIHPGAEIGEYFAIDHGTGVVIGETCIIGDHVTLYQGVTLGAKNFTLDSNGHPVNVPRHPILEDYVTVYSNASILGRITVGRGSVIGGNVWLANSVPPNSKVMQRKAVSANFTDGLGI